MARVSKDQIKRFENTAVTFDVHYIKIKSKSRFSSDTVYFFAQPANQELVVETHALVSKEIKAGKSSLGFTGGSEEAAVKKLTEYFNWYVKDGMQRERVIGIRHKDQWHRHEDNGVDGSIVVEFDFVIGEKVTAGKNVSIIPDRQYHKNGFYSACDVKSTTCKEYTWIPHTPALEKQCKEIIKKMKEIQKKIHEAFADEQKALTTLTNNRLLTFK